MIEGLCLIVAVLLAFAVIVALYDRMTSRRTCDKRRSAAGKTTRQIRTSGGSGRESGIITVIFMMVLFTFLILVFRAGSTGAVELQTWKSELRDETVDLSEIFKRGGQYPGNASGCIEFSDVIRAYGICPQPSFEAWHYRPLPMEADFKPDFITACLPCLMEIYRGH